MIDECQKEIVEITQNRTISLNNNLVPIDLMPMKLGEFNVVTKMDCLDLY